MLPFITVSFSLPTPTEPFLGPGLMLLEFNRITDFGGRNSSCRCLNTPSSTSDLHSEKDNTEQWDAVVH